MLEPGFTVHSPRGTIIEVLANAPDRFVLRRTLPPGTGKTPAHVHLDGVERFRLLAGRATGVVDGVERALEAGQAMEVPAGTSHVHPHTGEDRAVVEHVIEPRPRFVSVFFASYLTWLGEGRVDEQDEPPLLAVMAIMRVGGGGTWVAGPPVALQRGLAAVLGRVANARGWRPVEP